MTDSGDPRGADPNGAAYSGVAWTLRFGGLMAIVSGDELRPSCCADCTFLGGCCDLQKGSADQDGEGEMESSRSGFRGIDCSLLILGYEKTTSGDAGAEFGD